MQININLWNVVRYISIKIEASEIVKQVKIHFLFDFRLICYSNILQKKI